MEGVISIGSRVNAPHGRQDSDRSFLAKFPPVVVVGGIIYKVMECSHQKRADISLENLWQGRLKRRGAVKGYLPIYTAKLEIPVGKSNGLYLSVWETSENMGCDLCQCNFSVLFSLLR